MSVSSIQHISSRDNPLVQRLRRLAQEPMAYRKQGEVWLEGDHLCSACLARGVSVPVAVVADTTWIGEHGTASGDDARAALASRLARAAAKVVVLPETLWKAFTGLESPARIGFLLPLTASVEVAGTATDAPDIQPKARTVVLDSLQDAGNVGSILRSAAALGMSQVLALKGTAGLWSPKVLRAGMGAHFALRLVEQLDVNDLDALQVPLVGTSSHTKRVVSKVALPDPCAWVMGHEGQGVSEALQARCALTVTIPQPGGEESLNVAAAAAICLYESLRQRG